MQVRTYIVIAGSTCLLAFFLSGCGGGSGPPPPPTPDFSLFVSPFSVSVELGATSEVVSVSVNPQNGFAGSVSVEFQGLPAGVTSSPASPFSVTAGASQPVTLSVPKSTPTGRYTFTVRGTSGNLSHDAQLTATVRPVTRTYQEGSLLALETVGNNETVRVGLETEWGGTIVEVSLNGTNFVNRHDTGREIQAAFWDGNQAGETNGDCMGPAWNPTQGGDRFNRGSPLLAQTLSGDSVYIKTQPYLWCPDANGGGPDRPVLSDTYIEQTISAVAEHSRAFKVHYKITHFGTDEHANALQNFPATYVNVGLDRYVFYGGNAPWTNGPASYTAMPQWPGWSTMLYTPEQWGAFVDEQGVGLTVYVPGQYPYASGFAFTGDGTTGPTGDATITCNGYTPFSFLPGSVMEGDIYVIAGDYQKARQAVYDLRSTISVPDTFTPFEATDVPQPNGQVRGTIDVAGWAFDNVAVSKVEVLVDGFLTGAATYGLPRPDVATAYPGAPSNIGFQYSLDTTRYTNGPHLLQVKVTDASGNVGVFPNVPININN